MKTKTKIFVDGNCILCDMEIAHYKKIAPDLFDIVDINSKNFQPKDYKLTAQAVNQNMHVLTPEGEIKIGVDAFAHIWSRMEKYKLASKLIQKPVIHDVAKIGYKAFTKIRKYLPKKKR